MSTTLSLQIGPHKIKVRVTEERKPAMLSAARKVERLLEEMRGKQSVADNEILALMVALELALNAGDGDAGSEGGGGIEAILDEGLGVLDEA